MGGSTAERAAVAAQEYAEAIVATVREPLLVLDAKLKVITANRSFYQTFGVEPEETEGRLIYDLGNHQWDIPKLRDLLEKILPKNTSFNDYEVEHEFLDIGRRTMLLNARRVSKGANHTETVLLAIEDITDRKKAEEAVRGLNEELERRVTARTSELEAANEELGSFTYAVSHDLRAPLRACVGFSQVLLDEYADKLDEQGRDFLGRIDASAHHMGALIDALLRLSRLGRRSLDRRSIDLADIARRIVTRLRESQPDRVVEVVIPESLLASGDPKLVEIVLENLLANAWKFTANRPTPRITIESAIHEGSNAYIVRDNGAGFDEAYADKLFAPFQRLHSSIEFKGLGVGLVTVQRIVRRHGGRVWAEGRVGEGATFYFTLERSLEAK